MKLKIRTTEGTTYDLVKGAGVVRGLTFVHVDGPPPHDLDKRLTPEELATFKFSKWLPQPYLPLAISLLLVPEFDPLSIGPSDTSPETVLKRCQESDYVEILETDIEPDEEVPPDAVF